MSLLNCGPGGLPRPLPVLVFRQSQYSHTCVLEFHGMESLCTLCQDPHTCAAETALLSHTSPALQHTLLFYVMAKVVLVMVCEIDLLTYRG